MNRDLEALLIESQWVRRLAGQLVRNSNEADDVSQEVLARALEHRPKDHGPRLRAWLAAVTRNLVSQRGMREAHRSAIEASAARPEAVENEGLERLALHRLLVDAIESLSPEQREVVLLRYFDDLPPRKIAQQLGLPSTTIRKRLSRGLSHLRTHLDRANTEEDPKASRALWCAALTEHFPPPSVPFTATVLPALVTSAMLKIVLPASALICLLALGWKLKSAEEVEPMSSPAVSLRGEEGVDLFSTERGMTPTRNGSTREAVHLTESPGIGKPVLHVRVAERDGPHLPSAQLFREDPEGRAVAIPLNEEGNATLSPPETELRLFAIADGFAPAVRVVTPEPSLTPQVIVLELDALIDGGGQLTEDGGAPLHPVTLEAQLPVPDLGASLDVLRALRLDSENRTIRTAPDGSFSLPGIPPGTSIALELPGTHVYARRDFEFDADLQTVQADGSRWLLQTLRKPSIVARVVRADDQSPVVRADLSVQGINEFGRLIGEGWAESDDEGMLYGPIWLMGNANDYWASMSPGERHESAAFYAALQIEIAPLESDLLPYRTILRTVDGRTIHDLGTIELQTPALRRVQVVDASGHPLSGAVVEVESSPTVVANEEGIARVPSAEMDTLGIAALAHGHGIGFLPAEAVRKLAPEDDPIRIALSPCPELQLKLPASARGARGLRIRYEWSTTPFQTHPGTEYAFEFGLLEGLLGSDAMIHRFGYDRNDAHGYATAFSSFDSSGTAHLPALLPGTVISASIVEANSFRHPAQEIVVPHETGVHRIKMRYDPAEIARAPAWKIEGVVRDDVGRAVGGARVRWRHGGHYGTKGTVTTGPDGEFQIHAVLDAGDKPKDMDLWFEKPGLFPAQQVLEHEPEAPLEVNLLRARRVNVRVHDERSTGLNVENVRFPQISDTPQEASLGAGHLLFPCIPFETVTLEFDVGTRTYRRTLREGLDAFEMELPSHGELVLARSALPAKGRVYATLREEAPSAESSSIPRKFILHRWLPADTVNLLPGTYTLEVEGSPERIFTIRAGERVRIDLENT